MTNRKNSETPTKERTASEPLTKKELDKQLDHALKETFPGSDSIAVGQPTGDEVPTHEDDKAAAREAARREKAEEAAKQPADRPVHAPARQKDPKKEAPGKRQENRQKPE